MKKAMIVTLVCINVTLLGALVFVSEVPQARAQALRGATDYLMVTARIDSDTDALYVIDLAKRRMAGFLMDKTKKRMVAFGARRLKVDFGHQDLDK
ncbi:MAG TPA: hypothetical protein VNA25_08445 [Phycisphaerae bacterium]|nr:hypothetical protein [Phycisphaerae bacterium]